MKKVTRFHTAKKRQKKSTKQGNIIMSTNYSLYIPQDYKRKLSVRDTEKAIRLIKEFFQTNLAFELNLIRVTAPLFVKTGTGLNDELNGIERPVSFHMKALNEEKAEVFKSKILRVFGVTPVKKTIPEGKVKGFFTKKEDKKEKWPI